MSDGFRRVPSIFSKGKMSSLNVPKAQKPMFPSKLLRGKRTTDELTDEETIEKKVERLFDSQDLLFERLDSEPKLSLALKKSLGTIKHTTRSSARYVHKQPLAAKVSAIVIISLLSGAVSYFGGGTSLQNSVNEVAGVQSGAVQGTDTSKKTTRPSFDVVTPAGKEVEGVERQTPSGDTVYSFADELGGIRIAVTQQIKPDTFTQEEDTKLAEFAKMNYLGNVIQIDERMVYHGTNESSGIQSFVFVSDKNLVFIQSERVISDELMVGYISALKD